jgi:hypothetical protein
MIRIQSGVDSRVKWAAAVVDPSLAEQTCEETLHVSLF